MKYLSKFLWTYSWDVGTLVPNKSKFLALIWNISVLTGFFCMLWNALKSYKAYKKIQCVLDSTCYILTLLSLLWATFWDLWSCWSWILLCLNWQSFFCDDMTGGEWLNICRYCGSWWNSHIDVHRLWFLNQGNSIWKAYVVRMQFLLYAIFFTQFPHKPHLIDLVQHYSTKSKTKEIKEISGGEKMEVL